MDYLFRQNQTLKESLAGFLIVALFSLGGGWIFLSPQPAQAALSVYDIASAIGTAWEKVSDKIQNFLTENLVSVETWERIEQVTGNAIRAATVIALRMVLAMITNEIVKWIQGGGEPKFITNWSEFLKDVVDKAGGKFVDEYLGMGWLCEEFDIDIRIALLETPEFEDRVRCTITDIIDNIKDFSDNFSNGGWEAWVTMVEPQNNFYGAFLISYEEKLKVEQSAREKALLENKDGYIAPKVCVKGHTSAGGTCNNKDSCKALQKAEGEEGFTFYCDYEAVTTPASVISDTVSNIANQEIDLIRDQIADLTDSLGDFQPYVLVIGNALINRILKEGLSFIQGLGPSSDNPNAPLPPGNSNIPYDPAATQITSNLLIDQLNLFKENLETELLKEQQANLAVLQSIGEIQNGALSALAGIYQAGCALPYWATAQKISATQVNAVTTEEIIQISATDTGTATIKKTIIVGETSSSVSYQLTGMTPQINPEIIALNNIIVGTNQWIGDVATAIAAVNGYNLATQEYSILYQNTLQPPTAQEQAALDIKEDLVATALFSVIEKTQLAVRSQSETIEELGGDAQVKTMEVIQEANNLIFVRGISEDYPEPGTYYYKKSTANTKRSAAESGLLDCANRN